LARFHFIIAKKAKRISTSLTAYSDIKAPLPPPGSGLRMP